MKLLVVDDDSDMLAVISFSLRQAGFPVVRQTAMAPHLACFISRNRI